MNEYKIDILKELNDIQVNEPDFNSPLETPKSSDIDTTFTIDYETSVLTEDEKLDLILEKIDALEEQMQDLERERVKDIIELKALENMILSQVDRFYEVMIKTMEILKNR